MLKSVPVILLMSTGTAAFAQSGKDAITYMSCHVCHDGGAEANAIPAIAGMSYETLHDKLMGFTKAGDGSTIMHRFVAGLSAAEIESMARYISNLEGRSQ